MLLRGGASLILAGAFLADVALCQGLGDSAPGGHGMDQHDLAAPALVSPNESDRLAFEQAVAAGTNAALIMFLARERENPWIDEVRQRLAGRRSPDLPGAAAAFGPDAKVVEA